MKPFVAFLNFLFLGIFDRKGDSLEGRVTKKAAFGAAL